MKKAKKAQRFPSNIYLVFHLSLTMLLYFKTGKTGLWGQHTKGEVSESLNIHETLGIIDDWIYVADTIANLKDEWDNQYECICNKFKGEIKNKIENVCVFTPLSQYIHNGRKYEILLC